MIIAQVVTPLQTEGVAVWRGRGTNRLVEQKLHQQSNHYKVVSIIPLVLSPASQSQLTCHLLQIHSMLVRLA